MRRYSIEYAESPKHERKLWAWFDGTRTKAQRSALDLLQSLLEDNGLKRARVWLDGNRLRRRRITA